VGEGELTKKGEMDTSSAEMVLPNKRRLRGENRTKAQLRADEARREIFKQKWADPVYRERVSEGVQRSLATPKARRRRAKPLRDAWADPEKARKIIQAITVVESTLEARKRMSEIVRAAQSDPELRSRMAEINRKNLTNPNVRKRLSRSGKLAWRGNTTRRRQTSDRSKRLWAEPVLAQHAPDEPRRMGRPPKEELGRRVRELRAGPKPTSWNRIKLILDRDTGEARARSTYRWYARNP
jgi:hypothetical protein